MLQKDQKYKERESAFRDKAKKDIKTLSEEEKQQTTKVCTFLACNRHLPCESTVRLNFTKLDVLFVVYR